MYVDWYGLNKVGGTIAYEVGRWNTQTEKNIKAKVSNFVGRFLLKMREMRRIM